MSPSSVVRTGEQLEPQVDPCSSNRGVQAEDGQFGKGRARGERTREVNGIQGPDRVAGKRTAGSLHDVVVETQEVPVPAGPCQDPPAIHDIRFLYPFCRLRPDQHSFGFDQRQHRGQDLLGAGQEPPDLISLWLAEQPGEHRARLGVEPQRAPRSASSNPETDVDRSSGERRG